MFLSTAASCLGAIFVLNLVVNPVGKHPWSFVPPIVESARGEKLRLLEERSEKPQAIVLGSSRAMKLSPSMVESITGLSTFNAAVHSARAEDLLAFYRHIQQLPGPPLRTVILGLDIEAFHNRIPPDERLMRTEPLLKHLQDEAISHSRLQTILSDFSWPTLSATYTSLSVPANIRWREGPQTHFGPHGFVTYGRDERLIREGVFRLKPRLERSKRAYSARFHGFTELDASRVRRFEKLLNEATASGATVRIFVTPLHPTLVSHLERKTTFAIRRDEVLALLARSCEASGVIAFDATESSRFDADPMGFFDGAHANEENMNRLTRHLLGLNRCALQ